MMRTIVLYRPVGLKEWQRIIDSGNSAFPPRLEWQPIFYPVLNQLYAEQIALEWNTNDAFSGHCGIVTRFAVNEERYLKYPVQNVGGDIHNELWVPAEELNIFNQNIVGKIKVVRVFFGKEFVMPDHPQLKLTLAKFYTDGIQ